MISSETNIIRTRYINVTSYSAIEISKRIGVPTAGLLHIGNDRELDVLAARKAGLHAIQFGIDASGEEDFAVRDFAELIQVLLGGRSQ